jgi:DNA polymerase-4
MQILKKQVFKSINGYHWYMRLRGYEADAVEFSQKSIGHQHALSDKTKDLDKLERLLVKLCEKTGRRLRKGNYYATGIHLYLGFVREQSMDSPPIGFENIHQLSSWHHGEKVHYRLYSTLDIYEAAKKILKTAEIPRNVSIMSVHVFGLHPWNPEQLNIFDIDTRQEGIRLDRTHYSSISANKRVSDAVDNINNRYGEFVITPAMMLDMQGTILDRIAFGQVRDL